jgi:RNA polymerase sigma-70 factor (ECF subfamily)
MEEQEIIRLAREGDREAFETLVRLKREKVFWTAYQLVGNEDDARDVSQMVFLRLWRSLDRYDEQFSFNTWLHTITARLSIDFLRRQGRRRVVSGGFDEQQPGPQAVSRRPLAGQEEELDRQEVQRIFHFLARFLTERQRTIFVLRELEGMSMAEIAEVVGCRESTVRNHLFQARHTMREKLQRHFPEYVPRAGRGGSGGGRSAGPGEGAE